MARNRARVQLLAFTGAICSFGAALLIAGLLPSPKRCSWAPSPCYESGDFLHGSAPLLSHGFTWAQAVVFLGGVLCAVAMGLWFVVGGNPSERIVLVAAACTAVTGILMSSALSRNIGYPTVITPDVAVGFSGIFLGGYLLLLHPSKRLGVRFMRFRATGMVVTGFGWMATMFGTTYLVHIPRCSFAQHPEDVGPCYRAFNIGLGPMHWGIALIILAGVIGGSTMLTSAWFIRRTRGRALRPASSPIA
jgi:hypothetical protein